MLTLQDVGDDGGGHLERTPQGTIDNIPPQLLVEMVPAVSKREKDSRYYKEPLSIPINFTLTQSLQRSAGSTRSFTGIIQCCQYPHFLEHIGPWI